MYVCSGFIAVLTENHLRINLNTFLNLVLENVMNVLLITTTLIVTRINVVSRPMKLR